VLAVVLIADVTDTPVWVLGAATFVLGGAAWVALIGLGLASKERNAQVLADLSRRWDAPETYASLRLFRKHRQAGTIALLEDLWGPGVEHPDLDKQAIWHEMSLWPNLIETIAVFWSQKVLKEEIIYALWAGSIIAAWEEWEAPTQRIRDLSNDQTLWLNFQELASAMDELRDRKIRRTARYWINSPGCGASSRSLSSDAPPRENASQEEAAAADHTGSRVDSASSSSSSSPP
jgi:hypothetical protein